MKHILIIEDDPNIRETLKDILEMANYKVKTASNGKEGFNAILSDRPELVLCDVNMEGLNGFELLSAINNRLKDEVIPPFVFLTARVENQDIRHGMRLGADDYILKPFDHTEVLEIIKLRLEKRNKLLSNTTGNSSATKVPQNTYDKLAIPCEDGLEMIAFENIVKCEADRAYCKFHLADGRSILVSKAMKEFESLLYTKQFIRVHKSTIVNTKFIQKYVRGKGGYLLLTDGSHVNVSVRKKEELLKLLTFKG